MIEMDRKILYANMKIEWGREVRLNLDLKLLYHLKWLWTLYCFLKEIEEWAFSGEFFRRVSFLSGKLIKNQYLELLPEEFDDSEDHLLKISLRLTQAKFHALQAQMGHLFKNNFGLMNFFEVNWKIFKRDQISLTEWKIEKFG